MKVDVWSHFIPPACVRQIEQSAHHGAGPAAFILGNRPIHDLDARFVAMDRFEDYRQVLTLPSAPFIYQGLTGQALTDFIRRINDELAETVQRHPDRFVGFAAATPLADPDAATVEATRAVRELGALGVQLEEDVVAFPLHEERYDPLFAAMEALDAAVWLHPYRVRVSPTLPPEMAPLLLWQVFGWTVDTTLTVIRLILAGIYDRHPRLKLITHHGGGLIPHFSGRIELMTSLTGLDPALAEALGRLQKTPIEYCRMLYADTALFGAQHSMRSVVGFFGAERVLFGTDTPFDMRGGGWFIEVTIADVEGAVPDATERAKIFEENARRVLKIGA